MPPHPHPAPLGFASRQLPGVGAPPFWEPKDLEVELKPLFGCKVGEDDWGLGKACTDDWEPEPEPEPGPPMPPPPIDAGGYCGPIPSWGEPYDCGEERCAVSSCSEATEKCWPINPGAYSFKSRARPFFSYSEWKDGKLINADCSLIRVIAYHINSCQGSNDEVHIAIPAWWATGWPIAAAVESASARGVKVQIISGFESSNPDKWFHTDPDIKNRLETSIGGENLKLWDKVTHFWDISHNKFVLIRKWSATHQQYQQLVLISGANWAPFDVARHCDLLVVNSELIYGKFFLYWRALWNALDGLPIAYDKEVVDSEVGLSAHFWPVLNASLKPDMAGGDKDNNPFIKIINKFRPETTKIRIIAAFWTGGEFGVGPGSDMLNTLRDYRALGADVRVIGNHHLDIGCHNVGGCEVQPHSGKLEGSCETKDGIWQGLDNNLIPWAKCPPHAKVLLISGVRADDNVWHQAVYTGSMNISYGTGMPDAFIGVHDDPVIFDQYEAWWLWLCHHAALNRGGPACPLQGPPKPLPVAPFKPLSLEALWNSKPTH